MLEIHKNEGDMVTLLIVLKFFFSVRSEVILLNIETEYSLQ